MKQKLTARLSGKETYQFVKSYFKQEILWNKKVLGYKSNQQRLIAYNALIEDFKQATGVELTLSELRMKIKNLKSTYMLELKKISMRSEENYHYKPAMKWFALWHKYTQGTCNYDSTEELNTTDDENLNENSQKFWLPETTDNDCAEDTRDYSVDPFESQNNEVFGIVIKPEPKLEESDASDLNISENVNSSEDEFDIYGRYVASQLRNMDLQRALTLKLEIQNLMSAARLADLTERRNSRSILS